MYNAALHPAILENFWLRVGPFLLESGDEETFLPTQTLEAYTRNNMTPEKGQLEASLKHSSSKEVIVESSMKWYQMCTSHIHEGDKRTRQRTTDAQWFVPYPIDGATLEACCHQELHSAKFQRLQTPAFRVVDMTWSFPDFCWTNLLWLNN